jgi:hypothetical protein
MTKVTIVADRDPDRVMLKVQLHRYISPPLPRNKTENLNPKP